jgi:hypothetical protein
MTLTDVILRHGGEAQGARDGFAELSPKEQRQVIAFLNSLILFPPDDTASNLDPGNPSTPRLLPVTIPALTMITGCDGLRTAEDEGSVRR